MTTRLTPWFPADVKPARVGLYQREYSSDYTTVIPDFWDGTSWHVMDNGGCRVSGVGFPKKRWRGLASDPAVSK